MDMKPSGIQEDKRAGNDAVLSRLMGQWRSIEPTAGFEHAVWRRIRSSDVGRDKAASERVLDMVGLFSDRAFWLNAAAALVGIVVGVWVSSAYLPGKQDIRSFEEPLLHSRTVAGSYLAMVKGGHK